MEDRRLRVEELISRIGSGHPRLFRLSCSLLGACVGSAVVAVSFRYLFWPDAVFGFDIFDAAHWQQLRAVMSAQPSFHNFRTVIWFPSLAFSAAATIYAGFFAAHFLWRRFGEVQVLPQAGPTGPALPGTGISGRHDAAAAPEARIAQPAQEAKPAPVADAAVPDTRGQAPRSALAEAQKLTLARLGVREAAAILLAKAKSEIAAQGAGNESAIEGEENSAADADQSGAPDDAPDFAGPVRDDAGDVDDGGDESAVEDGDADPSRQEQDLAEFDPEADKIEYSDGCVSDSTVGLSPSDDPEAQAVRSAVIRRLAQLDYRSVVALVPFGNHVVDLVIVDRHEVQIVMIWNRVGVYDATEADGPVWIDQDGKSFPSPVDIGFKARFLASQVLQGKIAVSSRLVVIMAAGAIHEPGELESKWENAGVAVLDLNDAGDLQVLEAGIGLAIGEPDPVVVADIKAMSRTSPTGNTTV